jgi:hypothetical protein
MLKECFLGVGYSSVLELVLNTWKTLGCKKKNSFTTNNGRKISIKVPFLLTRAITPINRLHSEYYFTIHLPAF